MFGSRMNTDNLIESFVAKFSCINKFVLNPYRYQTLLQSSESSNDKERV